MKKLLIGLLALGSISTFACEYNLVDENYSSGSEIIRKTQVNRVKKIMKKKGYKLVEKNVALELTISSVCDCNWEEGQKLPGSATTIYLRKDRNELASFSSEGKDGDWYVYSLLAAKKATRLAIKKLKSNLAECSE